MKVTSYIHVTEFVVSCQHLWHLHVYILVKIRKASDRKKGHTTIPRDHCDETEHETHFFLQSVLTKFILKT